MRVPGLSMISKMPSRIRHAAAGKTWLTFLTLIFSLGLNAPSQETGPPRAQADSAHREYHEAFTRGEEAGRKGEFEKAITHFKKSRALARRESEAQGEAASLLRLGLLYWNTGNLQDSLQMFRQALPLAEKHRLQGMADYCRQAVAIHNLYAEGRSLRLQGQFQRAISVCEKAVGLSRSIQSREHEAKCLRLLSLVYWEMNRLQEFHDLNRQALELARELKHRQDEGKCLNNIGLFHWKLDNYSEALAHLEKALEIARAVGSPQVEAECLNNISLVFFDLGHFDRSLEYLKQTLDIDKKAGNLASVSMGLNNLGETFRRKGLQSDDRQDFLSALEYYSSSLELARELGEQKTEVKALNNLGATYSHLENYAEALKYFKNGYDKAKQFNDKEAEGMILNNIGIVYSSLGNYEESTKYYQEAIALALEFKGDKILWEAYLELADSFRQQGRVEEALKSYKSSIAIIEDIRSQINLEELKATYLGSDKRLEAYHNLIDLLVGLSRTSPDREYAAEAFHYLEKAKARAFLDSLEVSGMAPAGETAQNLLNQEAEVMNDISRLYTRLLTPQLSPEQKEALHQGIEACEETLEALKRRIRAASPDYAGLKYPKIITLREVQQRLTDSRTAYFAYCLTKSASYAFVITRTGLEILSLPPAAEIRKNVSDYVQAIGDVENRDFSLGHRLFCDLVGPGLKPRVKNIIVIPDDILYFLPFETLLTREEDTSWLVKDYRLAYAPSLSSLRELRQRKKARAQKPERDILAFGDPDYGAGENGNGPQNFYPLSDANLYRLKFSGL